MRGLLIKDFKTVTARNKTFLLLAIMIIFIMIFTDNPSFISGYVTVLCTVLVISTISYDEFDNGYAFLFTLPITRRLYVKEKYVFSLVYSSIIFVITTTIILVCAVVRNTEADATTMVTIFAVSVLILCIAIPVQLKYGSEKSRIAMLIIMGALVLLFVVPYFVLNELELGINTDSLTKTISLIPKLVFPILAALVALVAVLISYGLSVRIMEKKEF